MKLGIETITVLLPSLNIQPLLLRKFEKIFLFWEVTFHIFVC